MHLSPELVDLVADYLALFAIIVSLALLVAAATRQPLRADQPSQRSVG